jgi:hypothetical protein
MSLTIQINMMHNHVHKNTQYSHKVCTMYIQCAMCMYVCIIMGRNYIQNVHNMQRMHITLSTFHENNIYFVYWYYTYYVKVIRDLQKMYNVVFKMHIILFSMQKQLHNTLSKLQNIH